jgi:hypothetical protein
VLRSGEASVVFCAMPNGLGGKGSHTHCDKLSVVFRLGPDEVFCDSGSRCYTRSAELRNLDRSTRRTIPWWSMKRTRISFRPIPNCFFNAAMRRLFRLSRSAEGDEMVVRASHQGYSRLGIEHQRTVQLNERSLLVIDEVSGAGEHCLICALSWAPNGAFLLR